MFLKTLIPSMFHRRLLLLLGLGVVGMAPLGAQMWRLTIAKGDVLRREAEARLVRRQLTPTVRGSIVDRKGRVLALDRPSYDLAADYAVIIGKWTEEKARLLARRSAGAGWSDLTSQERRDRAEGFKPALRIHAENAWSELAQVAGVSRAELDQKRDQVIRSVDERRERHQKRMRDREIAEREAREEKITPELRSAIERRARQASISDEERPHILIPRVSDAVAFALQALEAEEVELVIPDPEGGNRLNIFERVPRIPGLRVLNGGDREYPFETIQVEIDRATFPTPLKSEEPLVVSVTGVACHLLGAIRDQVYGDTYVTHTDPATGETHRTDTIDTLGDVSLRAEYLRAHPEVDREARLHGGVDRGAYREGDHVGDTGIERSQEHTLRGLRGVRTLRLDTATQSTQPAVKGRDTHLTLDIALQARIQALMSREAGLAVVQSWHGQTESTQPTGEWLHGAAVVMDIETRDVLAMVSTPTYTREQWREHPETIFNDPLGTPYVNRAVSKPYQPGSIVKPLILAGAVQHGVYSLEQRIECTGHLLPNRPNLYRCWIYKQFHTTHTAKFGHDLDASEAIMGSCNIFFFTLGRRLDVAGIRAVYADYGVGEAFDIGLNNSRGENTVFSGRVGHFDRAPLALPDAIQMGIGQGPVAWTPLHAANAYATLALGGVSIPPRLVLGASRAEPRELDLDSRALAGAMDGLRGSVSDNDGTGHHVTIDGRRENIFNAPGVDVWGKTGTATTSPVLGKDPDGEGPSPRDILAKGDHSWFVVVVGRGRPQYAIAVVIDFGGSGGRVSGPLVNQIIHALIREEYL